MLEGEKAEAAWRDASSHDTKETSVTQALAGEKPEISWFITHTHNYEGSAYPAVTIYRGLYAEVRDEIVRVF